MGTKIFGVHYGVHMDAEKTMKQKRTADLQAVLLFIGVVWHEWSRQTMCIGSATCAYTVPWFTCSQCSPYKNRMEKC